MKPTGSLLPPCVLRPQRPGGPTAICDGKRFSLTQRLHIHVCALLLSPKVMFSLCCAGLFVGTHITLKLSAHHGVERNCG